MNNESLKCLLDFGELKNWRTYGNATCIYHLYATALNEVKLKKDSDKEYISNEALSRHFEGMVFSSQAIWNDVKPSFESKNDWGYWSVAPMTAAYTDFVAIMEGYSPKEKREILVAKREERRKDEQRRNE